MQGHWLIADILFEVESWKNVCLKISVHRCYIPNLVRIGLKVVEKKTFKVVNIITIGPKTNSSILHDLSMLSSDIWQAW
jgi:hypothetical protein